MPVNIRLSLPMPYLDMLHAKVNFFLCGKVNSDN